ncbi:MULTISPECIES: tripartite tricarboxylate transporter substrate binding protein [unclassified Ruegeria]|uniref:tripartite tricarboxylate transporter substrate binding protein n=1 Tax=unclassified Ruegeria TaxID=2625375 RepID=UPI0014885737|nr:MULTISPECIES: tripartite tricarboxylate transporter substrate binding protein [unclassified Ruegeria]NOD34532.1 tripartite tricarboxylate transporter substrate binding protein [Ruegeria sp. HKCCD7296]NOD77820.1 tripartite tricarboxylate transporter substrate binding protein [Ruegeria sp. HKCCD4332]NOD88051.1 tripartite tricarboxylate transporter substrate binding protein [Ruegeria sp. HKCCD4318]NOD93737.1 tripartite tricarboxylate transporter substrate binding protein [Ruegeria sp. HKCCD4884
MKKFLTAAALVASATAALAEYPEKPVSFVVPWPPGDLEDVLTRMIADEFQAMYGVPAAVVNKPGGGGGPFPGAVEVATAPADGYTIGSFVIGVPVIGPEIGIPELNPNPFDPIGIFLTYPFVIAASKDAPFSSWEELAEHGKENDVALGHFGSVLPPTQVTFAAAVSSGFDFASEAAFDALDCNTLASGDVDVINTTLQLILPCLDQVNVLASIGGERISLVPDTPTVVELNPDLPLALWNGLFVHKDTPADAREKISAAAQKALSSDKAKQLAEETGALIYWQDPDASNAQIEQDKASFAKIEEILGE